LAQADCSSRLSLLSAYCLCGWRCRQRLYVTAGDSEFYLLCIGSAKVLTFFFCFFNGHFSTEKKKRKCGCLFRPKIKRRKIKKCVFWRRKIKKNEIRSASSSRTLEHAYRRPFLTVLGEFEPQNVVGHRVDPQKALSYVTTRVLNHRA